MCCLNIDMTPGSNSFNKCSRFLGMLKDMVGNPAHPEGSIAEAYLIHECLTFSSLYLDGVETKHNRPDRNEDVQAEVDFKLSVFTNNGSGVGKPRPGMLTLDECHQARLYVLHNCEEVEEFVQ
jgi:hypothetical protein